MNINFEIQGFTWQAKRKYQQDAMLVNHQVIAKAQQATKLLQVDASVAWQIGVADGVGSKINSDLASITLLELLNQYFQHHQVYPTLNQLQIDLATYLKKYGIDKASTTLASVTYFPNDHQSVEIQSLGDSRVYHFSAIQQVWRCLTTDDILGNQIKFSVLDAKKELGSRYYSLTGFFSADHKHQVKNKSIIEHQLKPCDALLVCTDGVYSAEFIDHWPILKPTDHINDWIKAFAQQLAPKAHDNLSFIVVRCINIS